MKLDIVSLIFFIIIFACVMSGLKKGFFKIIINIIKGALSLVLAILFAKPLATLINNTPVGEWINQNLYNVFLNQGGVFTLTITPENKTEVINYALSEINIPSFLLETLSSVVSNMINIDGTVNVAQALSSGLTFYILIAVSFLLIFIFVLILSSILKKIFKKIEELPVIGTLNKILGAIFNGLIGVFVVCIITFAITLIIPFSPEFSSWFAETIMLEQDTFTLAKFFYENNVILKIITYLQELMA